MFGTLTAKKNTNFFKDLIIVVTFNAIIAVVLYLTNHANKSYLSFFYISQSMGCSIFALTSLMFYIVKPETKKIIFLVMCIALFLGVGLGVFIISFFIETELNLRLDGFTISLVVCGILFGVLAILFFIAQENYNQIKLDAREEKLKRMSAEKEQISTHLKMLQAQIEPHFLFNTLSNVLHLLDTDVDNGKRMLENFTDYLRDSLDKTRENKNSLGSELDMIEAYLNIFKIRMGDRLNFKIHVSEDLKKANLPPMIIQPVVENAIRHGLEPAIDGGSISIHAEKINETLKLIIADTGQGIDMTSPAGIGTKNIKNRIKSLYGDKGSFVIESNNPTGVKVIIEVPYE